MRNSATLSTFVNQMERYADIGSEIKACRIKHGFSQEELGALAGLSKSRICRIEKGELDYLPSLQAVAGTLGLKFALVPDGPQSSKELKKRLLLHDLQKMGCLWSYDVNAPNEICDDTIIEKGLLYLEFEDLHRLTEIWPLKKIKAIWRTRLVPQGEYYAIINWLLAAMFFEIKHPDQYLKRYGNKLDTWAESGDLEGL